MPALLALLAALQAADRAALDAPVKDFSLRDVMKDGDARVSLSDFKGKKHLVVFFTSYTCDACLDYEGRKSAVMKDFAGKDVAFVAVRSSADDTADGMRKYATEKGYTIPVLDDPGSKLAAYFGVIVTPTFYLIDKDGKLRYRGGLDDSLREELVKRVYLKEAIEAVLAGKDPAVKEFKAVGCHMPREKAE
jgi:peroxiredoxin